MSKYRRIVFEWIGDLFVTPGKRFLSSLVLAAVNVQIPSGCRFED